jgi:hypothetical protein
MPVRYDRVEASPSLDKHDKNAIEETEAPELSKAR